MGVMTANAGPRQDSGELASLARSAPSAVLEQARRLGDREYLRYHQDGSWQSLTWSQFAERGLRIAEGLVGAGLQPGDRVAMISENRVEWLLCDLGIQAAGCVTVPIYPSSQPRIVRHIVNDSNAKVLVASTQVLAMKLEPPTEARVLLMNDQVAGWLGASDPARRAEVMMRLGAIRPDDIASVVYTSGTTGDPKGVILLHRNFLAAAEGGLKVFDLGPADTLLSFLPYSHVLERVDGIFTPTCAGCTIVLARSIDPASLMEDIRQVRPTVMLGVPRIFDRVFDGVNDLLGKQPAYKQALFRWAERVAVRHLNHNHEDGPGLELRLAHRLVLDSLREKLTGGRLRFFISGGAPLNEKVEEFYWALGVQILQGWGMTETTSGATTNTEDYHRYRTVGKALPGVEIRIAPDGEIQVRGPVNTIGYLNRPDATAELLDRDGWLSTGDIGFMDADGFLTITDRKKDLIKTAGGKYIAPLPIEAKLQSTRLIKDAMVIGDARPYAVALIVPDWEAIAAQIGLTGEPGELRNDERVRALVQREVDICNQDLAGFETIKRFALLTNDFSEEADELTPTLKPKRKMIAAHHAEEIEALYAAARESVPAGR
jgi:long-chain acyl-CoA synthetase